VILGLSSNDAPADMNPFHLQACYYKCCHCCKQVRHFLSLSCIHLHTHLQAVRLLAEFCRTTPEDYDAQYATNQVSVRLAGDVVACLAELQPKVVSNCISQLRPYLGCAKAYCLRGSLLAAVGSILVQVSVGSGGLRATALSQLWHSLTWQACVNAPLCAPHTTVSAMCCDCCSDMIPTCNLLTNPHSLASLCLLIAIFWYLTLHPSAAALRPGRCSPPMR
jgi:hypothetical protein